MADNVNLNWPHLHMRQAQRGIEHLAMHDADDHSKAWAHQRLTTHHKVTACKAGAELHQLDRRSRRPQKAIGCTEKRIPQNARKRMPSWARVTRAT